MTFTLQYSHLLTCSAFSSTSGRVLEAQMWLGGRRGIQLAYTAQRSDKAEEEQSLESQDCALGLVQGFK